MIPFAHFYQKQPLTCVSLFYINSTQNIETVIEMFYRLPGVPAESPPSELFITQLDRVLYSLLQFICFKKRSWTT